MGMQVTMVDQSGIQDSRDCSTKVPLSKLRVLVSIHGVLSMHQVGEGSKHHSKHVLNSKLMIPHTIFIYIYLSNPI